MHSSIIGYLGCFHGLALVNSASFIHVFVDFLMVAILTGVR